MTNSQSVEQDGIVAGDIFGKLVAAECEKIKSNHVKRVFKKKVMDLLFEAQEDEGTSVSE